MIYNPDNIFAKIISGQILTSKIYEDEQVIAIHDKNPIAPIHVLVIPKKNYLDFDDFVSRSSDQEIANYYKAIVKVATICGADQYSLTTNKGPEAGQSIFHFHTHLISGKDIITLASVKAA